jgi:LEA14-like dessication related protein
MKNTLSLSFLLLAIVLFSSCKDFKEITVSKIDKFQVKELNQEGITAEVKVSINNPNPIGFNVYRSKCDVYYGGIYLGKAKLSKKVRIAPNSNSEHTFQLSGKFKDMSFADVGTLLAGGSKNLELKGYLKAGKFFYKKKFPLDRKEKISFFK